MTRTRTRRARRPVIGTAPRTRVGRIRADLGSEDAVEAFADLQVGATVEPSLVLDPFGLDRAGHRADRGDLLEVQPHGVDARGSLERYPLPDGDGLVPVLRVGDLAILLLGAECVPTRARLEVEGFLYALPFAWDRFHGVRVPGARRRWRLVGVQRRDVDGSRSPGETIVRTSVDRVPEREALGDGSLVELDLRRP